MSSRNFCKHHDLLLNIKLENEMNNSHSRFEPNVILCQLHFYLNSHYTLLYYTRLYQKFFMLTMIIALMWRLNHHKPYFMAHLLQVSTSCPLLRINVFSRIHYLFANFGSKFDIVKDWKYWFIDLYIAKIMDTLQ